MTFALAVAYVIAASMLVRSVLTRGERSVHARLTEMAQPGRPDTASPLSVVGRLLPAPLRVRSMRRFGLTEAETDRLVGAKALLGGLGFLLGMVSAGTPPERIGLGSILALGGYTIPTFRAARRERARTAELRGSLPELLDLVAVSVSAGLTPRLALERAAKVVGEPLSSAFERIRAAVSVGTPWLAALRSAEDVARLDEVKRLASTLALSARLGSPVGERLRGLANDVRSERRAEAEERARRAPVTMLFPLVFLILPAFVLTAVVPAVIVATRGVG
jgi:pilus assembly protein TadC